jgi:branched-subunit amino acid ABC-type transport system permease component
VGQFLSYAIPGIPYGCTFAIVAVGLVLTYQATGVFNFAFGAQAYVSAYVYALLTEHGMNRFGAFAVSVLLLAPLLGLLFDRLLFSRIARANVTAKIVSALGLFVGLPSLLAVVFGSATRYAPPSVLFNPATVYFHVGSTPINGIELATVIVTVVVVVALMVLLRYTAYGLKMRAAVESGRLLELDGVNASAVVSSAWMISSLLAGLAGVLLAPQYPTVSSNTYAVLLVAAIAAAALGALRSIPLALVGGIALGVVEGLASGYFAPGSILHTGLLPAIPFLALVFLLLFLPGMRSLDEPNDPLSSVDPPIPPSITTTRSRDIDRVVRVGRWALAIFFVFSVLTWVPGNWVFTLSTGIALSTIFLSITLITGMGGQLSLCQATFAGIGAFAAGQLALHAGLPILLGAVTGALLAAVIGAVAALPALRLRGLPLALLTLSFALLADYVAFPPSWAGGPVTGLNVPRPQIGPINFATSSTRAFFLLALVMLVLASTVVLLIQRGTLGRFLGAMRGSPVGAASIGINLSWTKVLLFALSAGLAGLGGAVYGSLQQVVTPVDFNYEFSLIFVVVVVTTGVNTVEGAIQAGIGFVVIQQLLSYLPGRAGSGSLTVLLFALGALTYARHPEGVVEYQKRIWTERFEGLFDRRNPQGQGELALPGGSPGGAS